MEDILKNGVRSTKKAVWGSLFMYTESPNYFGSGHFMLKKSEFPDEYKIWQDVLSGDDYMTPRFHTDKDVKKAFAYKSGKSVLFKPTNSDDYPSVMQGDNRFNAKYYWLLCKKMGCALYFGDYGTPIAIKKGRKIVGYAMPLRLN